MVKDDINEDIKKIIKRFDMFLDDMYDQGAFDLSNKNDMELNDFIDEMKQKYGVWYMDNFYLKARWISYGKLLTFDVDNFRKIIPDYSFFVNRNYFWK